jgi:hypothetical protein
VAPATIEMGMVGGIGIGDNDLHGAARGSRF